jgi:uncharacterized protein
MSRPLVPLSQITLKIHSRCDLACDHCYVFEAAGRSWRPGLRGRLFAAAVQVILHGGSLYGQAAPPRADHHHVRGRPDGVHDLDLRVPLIGLV